MFFSSLGGGRCRNATGMPACKIRTACTTGRKDRSIKVEWWEGTNAKRVDRMRLAAHDNSGGVHQSRKPLTAACRLDAPGYVSACRWRTCRAGGRRGLARSVLRVSSGKWP